jgi:hypothetical protein
MISMGVGEGEIRQKPNNINDFCNSDSVLNRLRRGLKLLVFTASVPAPTGVVRESGFCFWPW